MEYTKEIKESIMMNRKTLQIDHLKSIKLISLGTGENNLNILAIINNTHKFVYRIGLRSALEKNMEKEFLSMKILPKNIGPIPIMLDMSKKIIPKVYSVQSYIEGKHLRRLNNVQLRLHVKKMAQLHKRKYPYWGTVVKKYYPKTKPYSQYRFLLAEHKDWVKHDPKLLKDKYVKKYYPIIKKYIRKNDFLFKNLREFHIVNKDLCLTNMIFSKNNLQYIDWEWQCFGDNAVDLALLFNEHYDILPWKIKMDAKLQDWYTDEYLKYVHDPTLKQRVKVLAEYYKFLDYVFFLWKKYDSIKTSLDNKIYLRDLLLQRKSLEKTLLKQQI